MYGILHKSELALVTSLVLAPNPRPLVGYTLENYG